eukprot:TRINITY_DN16846_c0_g3_i1.p1 TRINITY_DN16846_c0_g3~~TRINITY_DN16846_c0_g3_i1.p1  ORF type:complete len:342 (-),score=70.51 TRINITY_DN16846_c0_g3_i1:201-1226(-)
MSWLAIAVVLALVVASVIWILVLVQRAQRPDPLEELGVRASYPSEILPVSKIDAYYELKDQLHGQFAKGAQGDSWMRTLPPQAKDSLKYRLMQRAIGDMASLQKIDIDARGFWKLFSKGIVTKQFWSSVLEAEKELTSEIESVKVEAAAIEPTQDPQGIIAEAMQFVVRFGDQLPSAEDVASSADKLAELMKHLPGAPGGKLPPLLPPGASPGGAMPPMPPGGFPPGAFPPGGPPPGYRPPQAQPPPSGGEEGKYKWKQDGEELEVAVDVPATATKAEIKVVFQPRALKVLHRGETLIEGPLAGMCCPEGSTWTLGKGRVVVSLEKANQKPWPALFAPAKS